MDGNKEMKDLGATSSFAPEPITSRDVRLAWFRWWWSAEISNSFERMQAPSFLWAIRPILKKLYKMPEELKEAYRRHLLFFNTQGIWGGGSILGITIALEDTRAKKLAEGKLEDADSSIINSTKVGLMGPLAGIGDSIDFATFQYLLIAIALPWAKSGSALGALFPVIVFSVSAYYYGFYFAKQGYALGRAWITELSGDALHSLTTGLSVLGFFMMGILAATYIVVATPLKGTISGKLFEVQPLLDKILPGLLPLVTVMLVYQFFAKRGLKVTQALMWMVIVLFVLGLVGVL